MGQTFLCEGNVFYKVNVGKKGEDLFAKSEVLKLCGGIEMSGKVVVFCEGRMRFIYQVQLMCDMFVGPFLIMPHDHVASTRASGASNCGAFLDYNA